jgi:hypothetical protein
MINGKINFFLAEFSSFIIYPDEMALEVFDQ